MDFNNTKDFTNCYIMDLFQKVLHIIQVKIYYILIKNYPKIKNYYIIIFGNPSFNQTIALWIIVLLILFKVVVI